MGGWLRGSYDDEDERFGRAFGHWTLSREENYFDDLANAPKDIQIISLKRDDKNWDILPSLSALEEATAINPTKKQLSLLYTCKGLKRLRLWTTRGAHFDDLEELQDLEELACFNVSGPKSLGPVAKLPKLRSLLIENMRSLSDWSALGEARSLKCLCISGGFVEALQEVQSLDFLENLAELSHLHTGSVRCRSDWPAFRGLKYLKNLQTLHINPYFFTLDDHAYLEAIVSEEKRLFKGLYTVGGRDQDNIATTWNAAKNLPDDRLKFAPRVKSQLGLPFTREYMGDRDEVLKRVAAFEAHYQRVFQAARQ